MPEVEITIKLKCIHCADCSMFFGVPDDFEARRRKDHSSFYCPAGHSNHFPQESEEDKLRKRLQAETLAKELAQRETEAAKQAHENMQKRVAAGSCPCCKRTFKQLAAHMTRKHPEYPR